MRLPAPSLPEKKALRDMVGLIIPDNTRPAISWQGCSLGIWGGVSGSISIAHMPKHIFRGPGSVAAFVTNVWDSRSLFRIAVMEIARLMKRKQKRRSDFTGWRFC